MDEYRLQTELSDETRRTVALQAEKHILEAKIEDQKREMSKKFHTAICISSLVVLIYAVAGLLLSGSFGVFFFISLGIPYSLEITWLFYGLRKQQKKLNDLKTLTAETQNQSYNR